MNSASMAPVAARHPAVRVAHRNNTARSVELNSDDFQFHRAINSSKGWAASRSKHFRIVMLLHIYHAGREPNVGCVRRALVAACSDCRFYRRGRFLFVGRRDHAGSGSGVGSITSGSGSSGSRTGGGGNCSGSGSGGGSFGSGSVIVPSLTAVRLSLPLSVSIWSVPP